VLTERLAVARRLELTDAVESGDRVEGFFRRVKISIEDHGLERTLRLDVDRPSKWVSIAPYSKDLNDPDVVTTGDAAFDEAITVLAQDGAAPSVGAVFAHAGLRSLAQEFFQKFPMASFSGSTLTVLHVSPTHPGTAAALKWATDLVLLLREASDAAPRLPSELAPVLEKGPEPAPHPLWPEDKFQPVPSEKFEGVGPEDHSKLVLLVWAAIAAFAAIFYFSA